MGVALADYLGRLGDMVQVTMTDVLKIPQVAKALHMPDEIKPKRMPMEPPIQLWDAKLCAHYFADRDVDYFNQHIKTVPGFPSPIIPPNAKGGRMQPMWEPAEVIAWAKRYRMAA